MLPLIFIGTICIALENNSFKGVDSSKPTFNKIESKFKIKEGCCGHGDEIPPIVRLSVGNSSTLLSGFIFFLTVEENNPADKAFKVFYNWDGEKNSSVTNPVEPINLTMPEIEMAHELNTYAVDTQENWGIKKFVLITTSNSNMVNIIPISSTHLIRRTDGFLIFPIVIIIIGIAPLITWKRNH